MARRSRPPGSGSAALLGELAALRLEFGPVAAARRLELLRGLDRARLASGAQVLELHELLLFARAYPDDAVLLAQVEAMLARFGRRGDLRHFRRWLDDSGIAGTDIRYPFFFPTAVRLAKLFPRQLHVDWPAWEKKGELEAMLHLLVPYAETPAIDEFVLTPRQWIELFRGPQEAGGAFLARRFAAMAGDSFVRETSYDRLSPALRLAGSDATPSRTHARAPVERIAFQVAPLDGGRPDLERAVRAIPLGVRELGRREGARYVALAQNAMVTRSRDLDAFSWADPAEVRLVACDDGLAFALLGVAPERRLLLESVYGALTLKNGVPIGYVLISSLFGSAEIAYNVFETYRGAEAAPVFARVLALAHRLFGARTFSIDPYQLGHFGNHEGLHSGAWWFYAKLGFRPRDPEVVPLANRELAAQRRDHGHRTDLAMLDRLASAHLFYSLGRARGVALGALSPGRIGQRIARYLAERVGAERERGLAAAEREAAKLCGVRSFAGWSAGERLAWRRWSPLLLAIPGIARWSAAERRAAAGVARAKGGLRESDFVRAFDAHPKLRRALLVLATPD
jgi:hypothetical protein